MKKIIIVTVFLSTLFTTAHAQPGAVPLPIATTLTPYKLEVGYNTTTVLIFPVPVISGDRGFTDIFVQKEKDVENVLKIKAAVKNFRPTNLHVYTKDGKVYPFTVEYVDFPARLTYNLSALTTSLSSTDPLIVPDVPLTTTELRKMADTIKSFRPFLSKKQKRHGIKLELKSIYTANNTLFIR
ncbi:MAG: DUF4138 domain-containing protein, partial [Chitinophagaceae bacterium]